MSFVQCSHRGHETDGTVVVQLFAAPLAKDGDLTEDFDGGTRYDGVFTSCL